MAYFGIITWNPEVSWARFEMSKKKQALGFITAHVQGPQNDVQPRKKKNKTGL